MQNNCMNIHEERQIRDERGMIKILEETIGNGHLSYALIKQSQEYEGDIVDSYGIRIICSLFGAQEEIEMLDITSDYSVARELFELVTVNLVTPVTLKDVVEDYIYDKYQ